MIFSSVNFKEAGNKFRYKYGMEQQWQVLLMESSSTTMRKIKKNRKRKL